MNIKEIRKNNLLRLIRDFKTQESFADAVELDPRYISQLVRGNRNIGDRTAAKVEQALQLPAGAMDRATDAPPTPDANLKLTVAERQLLRLYRDCDDEGQEFIMASAHSAAQNRRAGKAS